MNFVTVIMVAHYKSLFLSFILLAYALPAQAAFPKPGDWKPLAPNPSPGSMKCVAYGDGLWVAVGDFGRIATSTDGLNWTLQESSAPKDWTVDQTNGYEIVSVAYGDGKWRACGASGRVYASTDGTSWSNEVAYTSGDYNHLEEIVYADGLWVMTGDYEGVFTSTDGDTWTKRPINDGFWVWAIGNGNGRWVCVDYYGKVFESSDGSSWTRKGTIPVLEHQFVEDVHFADGLWVAVTGKLEEDGSSKIFSSSDLDTWTERKDVPVMYLTSVSHSDGLWVASGGANGVKDALFDFTYEGGKLLTSSDGIIWTDQTTPRTARLWEVAYGDGLWVASAGHGSMTYSDNGTDWKSNEAHTPTMVPRLQDAAYHDGLWIVTLREGTILQSTDGQHWSSRVLDDGVKPDWLQDILYSERLQKWFIGGDFGKLWSSSDGFDWTDVSIGIRGTEAMVEGGGKLLCAGRGWDLYSSEDGETWTEVDHPQKGVASGRFTGAAYGDATWALGGSGGVVLRSSDSASWSKATISGAADIEDIHYENGLWVACDDRGAVFWSTDLQSWTKGSQPSSEYDQNFNNVDYIDSTWIVTGWSDWSGGHLYTSTDGKSWTRQPPILFPGGALEEIIKVEDDWWVFGRTLETGFVMSTKDFPVDNPDRSLIFTDPESYTVTDTDEPDQFTSLPMSETLGGGDETLYLSFNIKRESGFGAQLDFTALQLSRSATNLPMKEDLGFGNSGPFQYYGIIVEGPLPSLSPDVQVPLDNETHTIIARIDYAAGTVAMVTDPQSVSDIESATRHEAPTNPFSTIMLRAGHNDTSYTYSRIALGESVEAVLDFTQEAEPPIPNEDLDPGNRREWEWKNPVLSSEDFEDVAYGGGRYVAVSRAAQIIWSDDGVTWQHAAELPTWGLDLYGVAYGGGRWVAIGFRTAYTSTDGVHWEALEEFDTRDMDAIAYHNTRWVMVGDSIHTSRNGTVWEEVAVVSEGYFTSVAYGNDLWVVASLEGEVLTSPDGVTWTQRREAPAEREWIQDARYAEGRWFLAGSNLIVTSTDGFTWNAHAAGDPSGVNQLHDVIPVGDGRWLALGWNRLLADDPVSWPSTETPGPTLVAAAFGNQDRVVFVGDDGGLYTTTDLVAWVDGNDSALQTIGPGEGSTQVKTITEFAYGNGIWLGASSRGDLTSQLWRSTDGDDYTLVPTPVPEAYLLSLSYGEGEFFATTFRGRIFTSSDGLDWTEVAASDKPAAPNGSHVANGQRVVVGGSAILHGPSGSNEPLRAAVVSTTIPLRDVTYGNETWVAVGAQGMILTASSPDRWQVQSVPLVGRTILEHVAFVNGVFFASGAGVVVYSSDGISWFLTTHLPAEGEVVAGFAYHEEIGKWYSASYDTRGRGWLYVSNDELNWRFLGSVSRRGHRHLIYADGQLVLAGEGGQIMAHGTPQLTEPGPEPELTAFESWMKANGINSPSASALETYALATDRGAPVIGVDNSGIDSLYSTELRKDLEGIQVFAEYSTDLIEWQDISSTTKTTQIDAEMNGHIWSADKDPSGTGYLRLKFVLEE